MNELTVTVLDEPQAVATHRELSQVLRTRVGGGNHFQIASADAIYPMLDVLVRGPYAVVHYFPREGEAGQQAATTVTGAPDELSFPHSALGDTITMPGAVLVDIAIAVECVEQFARTLARPTRVGWIDL